MDSPQTRGGNGFDRDALAQGPVQKFGHARDQSIDVYRPRLEGLTTRKCQQLLSQRRSAVGPLKRRFNAFANPRIVGLQASLQDFKVSNDYTQHIVEVMGDAARELAQSLHLLRLTQNFLCAFAFFSFSSESRFRLQAIGEVASQFGKSEQFAAVVADRCDQNASPKL